MSVRKYISRYRNGEIEARDRIFFMYQTYVEDIARKFIDLGVSLEELISISHEVLLNFIESNTSSNFNMYNLRKKVIKYLGLEILYVNGFIYLHEKYLTMENKMDIIRAKRELSKDLGRTPSCEEISKKSGVELYSVVRFFKYHEKVVYADLSNIPYEVRNQIANNVVDVENAFIHKELFEGLSRVFEDLTDREKLFVRLKYFEGNLSSLQIAEALNENVRSLMFIENSALTKLKKYISFFNDLALHHDLSKRANLPQRRIKTQDVTISLNFPNIKRSETLNELFLRYRNGDDTARDVIFFRFKSVAEDLAKDFFDLGLDNEDILAETYLLLFECISFYRNVIDVQLFSKDWKKFIEVRLSNYVLSNLDLTSSKLNKQDVINFLKVRRQITEETLEEPDMEVLFQETGISFNDFRELYNSLMHTDLSVVVPLSIEDINNPEDRYVYEDTRILLESILKSVLPEKYEEVCYMIYMNRVPLKDIAKLYGFFPSYVSYMKSKIVSLLRSNCLEYFKELAEDKDSFESMKYSLIAK